MKKLTVIVPTYNHGKYVIECLEHIVSQKTNFDFDVIVYDDCSKDNTVKKAEEFAKNYPNIKVVKHENNIGMLQNYKQAFEKIETEYVAICEGDDYWCKNDKLQKQVDLLDSNLDATMCFHHFAGKCEWDGKIIDRGEKHTYRKEILTIEDVFNVRVIGNFSVCVYRTKFIKNVPENYYNTKDAADFLFNLYILEQGRALCLQEVNSIYRIHNKSQWSSLTDDEKLDMTLGFVLTYCSLFQGKYQEGFKKIINDAYKDFKNVNSPAPKYKIYKFKFFFIPILTIKVVKNPIKLYFSLFGIKLFNLKEKIIWS